MHISAKGLALVKAFESCLKPVPGLPGHFRAYKCPADKLTIGWGHTNDHGRQFNAGSVWTQDECDAELATDMQHFERVVDRLVKVELKQHQFDALVSFAYNCGEGALSGSTLLKKVNNGEFGAAAEEFNKWVHANGVKLNGLVRRRASESLLFQGIADDDFDGKPDQLIHIGETEAVPQTVDPPKEPSVSVQQGTAITTGGVIGTAGTEAGKTVDPGQTIDALQHALQPLQVILKSVQYLCIVLTCIGVGITLWSIFSSQQISRSR
jgi:lysozyme